MKSFNNEQYLQLMDEWKKTRGYEPFCLDGLLDEDQWGNSSRIMFLLKETYGDWYTIHNEGAQGPDGGSNRFWRNMRMYTYIIDEMVKGNTPNLDEALRIKEEPNDTVAYVNIKKLVNKTDEDDKNSSDADIETFAKRDKDFLLRQIELISPKIIVCAGTFGFRRTIFDNITELNHNVSKTNDILLLGYYHLSYYGIGYEEEFNDLIKIIGGYLGK
jgi:hypothetical protein